MDKSVWFKPFGVLTNRWVLAVLIALPMLAAIRTAGLSFDEAIWSYIGSGWTMEGVKPYLQRFDNKPPGILLLFGLADQGVGVNTWLVRWIGVAAMVVAGLLLYACGRCLLDRTTGALAMLLFGLTMPRAIVDGPYAAHTESFMVLFSVLAFYLLMRAFQCVQLRTCLIASFLAWLSMGVAIFCFKQAAVLTAAGLFAFYLLHRKSGVVKTGLLRDLTVAAAGMASAMLLAIGPLILSGVPVEEYYRAVWISPRYAGATNASVFQRIMGFFGTWQDTQLLVFVPLMGLFAAQRRLLMAAGVPVAGWVAWLLFDFLGANASGNYYGHQLKQAIPPLALVCGLGIRAVLRGLKDEAMRLPKRATLVLAVVLLSLMPYGTLLQAALQGPRPEPERELGNWIRNHSAPTDVIFPCGARSMHILAWSGRGTPFRYFNPMYMAMPGAWMELERGLVQLPPRYIIVPEAGLDTLAPCVQVVRARLDALIAQSYTSATVRGGYRIYERRVDP